MTGIPVDLYAGTAPLRATHVGQLVTAPFDYDLVVSKNMAVINTAYNFYDPKPSYKFVITGILMGGDRNIGNLGSLTVVYQATSPTTLTESRTIMSVDIAKNGTRDILPMNVLIDEGAYINAKCDDNNVYVSITGYYIPLTVKHR